MSFKSDIENFFILKYLSSIIIGYSFLYLNFLITKIIVYLYTNFVLKNTKIQNTKNKKIQNTKIQK